MGFVSNVNDINGFLLRTLYSIYSVR